MSSPAKIILFGEHSVVYDKLGIAGAINPRTDVTVTKSNKIKIILEDYNKIRVTTKKELDFILKEIEKMKENQDYYILKGLSSNPTLVAKAVVAKSIENLDIKPFMVKIRSDIPIGGFGSSSSVFASTAAGIHQFFGKEIDKKEIVDIANLGDVICHGGTPSGIDASTVTYGGYIQYQKSNGLKPLKIKSKIPLVIGNTGTPAKTSVTVPHVRKLRQKNPKKINYHLDEMHKIAKQGIKEVKRGNLAEIGRLMNENQRHLRVIEISHPKLENLIEASLKAGALGAKLTGGGGGGIMIALCEDKEQQRKVSGAIRNAGGTPIITELGVEGIRGEN